MPDEATILVCPAEFAGAGRFHVALFAWALLGFAGVYSAIARRAFDDTVAKMHQGGDRPAKIVACKHDVVTRAFTVVDTALDLTGGSGIFKSSRMEQLFRDARLGRIHPGNSLLTHDLVGKLGLGIDPDEQPRWG